MSRLLRRLASVGSVFLGYYSFQSWLRDLFGLTDAVALGGTSLLIVLLRNETIRGYLFKQ